MLLVNSLVIVYIRSFFQLSIITGITIQAVGLLATCFYWGWGLDTIPSVYVWNVYLAVFREQIFVLAAKKNWIRLRDYMTSPHHDIPGSCRALNSRNSNDSTIFYSWEHISDSITTMQDSDMHPARHHISDLVNLRRLYCCIVKNIYISSFGRSFVK